MKRKVFIFVLMIVVVVSGFVSCRKSRGIIDIHNSRISLDWTGEYTGTIPSADGSGIEASLKLNINDTYELTYKYLKNPDNPFTWTGSFSWDETGEFITIDIADAPSHYKVAQNKLIQLDMKGNYITGALADNYILKKD
jgi:copper homeostasis protein (lipoprotein)